MAKNSYIKLELILDKKINKNSKLGIILNKKINMNLYIELRPTLVKKIGKNSNKKLRPSFIYNDIYLKKKFVLITKINNKIYEQKIYNKAIANLIYSIKWQ